MFETTVLNGLPVTVCYDSEDWWISQVASRNVRNADWVYKRMGVKGRDAVDEQVAELRADYRMYGNY